MSKDEPDEVLLLAYRAGDVRAFERLVAAPRKAAVELHAPLRGDPTTAEDLLQEVFLRVVRARDEWRGSAKFSTWLYTIARNLTVDYARRAVHRETTSLDGPGAPMRDATLHDRIDRWPRRQRAWSRTARPRRASTTRSPTLPAEQREVFLMREVMEMPFAEIADRGRCVAEPTVKSRMRYALERLRQALLEFRDPGAPPAAEQAERGHDLRRRQRATGRLPVR